MLNCRRCGGALLFEDEGYGAQYVCLACARPYTTTGKLIGVLVKPVVLKHPWLCCHMCGYRWRQKCAEPPGTCPRCKRSLVKGNN